MEKQIFFLFFFFFVFVFCFVQHSVSTTNKEETPCYSELYSVSLLWSYLLTARVVGAPQVISQPVSAIFFCSPLPPGTWRTPGLSIPFCLPTCSSVYLKSRGRLQTKSLIWGLHLDVIYLLADTWFEKACTFKMASPLSCCTIQWSALREHLEEHNKPPNTNLVGNVFKHFKINYFLLFLT